MVEPDSPDIGSRRFEVRRRLGSGGMGDVYEAFDRETGWTVALKTLRRLDGESLYRFKNEFRALADLAHVNLVRYGELHCENEQWFFTMELVEGTELDRYVRTDDAAILAELRHGAIALTTRTMAGKPILYPSSGDSANETVLEKPRSQRAAVEREASPAFDEARLRAALAQLAIAIDTVHASGRVHKDIKPSNALVCDDGRVVLLDFGLADHAETEHSQGRIAGTPRYMAPEQVRGEPLGPEADWYAFGVLLFRALTGIEPFRGTNEEIFAAKCRFDAPHVHTVVSGVPADLQLLCHDLLQRERWQRPSGGEILRRLGVADRRVVDGRLDAEEKGPFVGRAVELAELEQALDESETGATVAVLVRGEPGIGKSELVRRFLDEVARRDRQCAILRGRCYEQESVPFRALDSVLDSLSQDLLGRSDDDVARLLGGGVHFLAGVFPVLTRVPAVARLAPRYQSVDDPTERRHLAFRQLKSLLAAVAAVTPLIIFIDDLQWADEDSLALLRDLLRPPDAPPCLLIATMRPVGEEASAQLDDLLACFRALPLAGLSEHEAEALLARLWTGDVHAKDRRRELAGEAAGHPLWLAELARHGDAPTGGHLEEVLWQRIESLDPPARRLVEVSSLVGAPVEHGVLAAVAEVDPNDCLSLLNRLRAAQLVRMIRRGDERLVEPYHDRIREAVITRLRDHDEAAVARVETLHERIGRELLARSGGTDEGLERVVFAIVSHLHQARGRLTTDAARRELALLDLRAGRKAKRATAYAVARGHIARAQALLSVDVWTQDYELARDLATEMMECTYLAGDATTGLALFETLFDKVRTDEERVELAISKIGVDTGQGRSLDAIATARRALRLCGVELPNPVKIVHLLTEYAAVRLRRGRRSIPELVTLPEMTDPAARMAMQVFMAVSPAAYFVDSQLLSFMLLRMSNLSLRLGLSDVSSYGFAGYGLVMTGAFGKHAEAHQLGELALALDRRFGNDRLSSRLYFVSGTYLAPWALPFAEAKQRIKKGCELGNRYGDAAYEAYSAATLSMMSLNEARDLAEQQACAEWARGITDLRRDRGMTGMVITHQRYYATMRGLTDDVLSLSTDESSDETFRASLSDETPLALFYYYLLRAELSYLFGDAARAEELLADAEPWVPGIFGVPTAVELNLLHVLVDAKQCEGAPWPTRLRRRRAMARRIKRLARWARACPENFEAQYLIACAEQARVAGDDDTACAKFEAAIVSARRHDAVKREALALELAARHSRALGETGKASAQLAEAIDAYRRWGAEARVDHLRDLC
jgi:predicted ATPase/serine/threonine protein kinase